jgi:hypothetical protein
MASVAAADGARERDGGGGEGGSAGRGETVRRREGETTKRGSAGAGRDGETARRGDGEMGRGKRGSAESDEGTRCRTPAPRRSRSEEDGEG